jgi:hypothetical protein
VALPGLPSGRPSSRNMAICCRSKREVEPGGRHWNAAACAPETATIEVLAAASVLMNNQPGLWM